jgi:hypothetical protein
VSRIPILKETMTGPLLWRSTPITRI